jgi:hypothetical protein
MRTAHPISVDIVACGWQEASCIVVHSISCGRLQAAWLVGHRICDNNEEYRWNSSKGIYGVRGGKGLQGVLFDMDNPPQGT